jgi:nitrite reductase/ring-hydroxylating ferredoxin subunit
VEGPVSTGRPVAARLDGAPLAVAGGEGGPSALYARCSHLGGPLEEGDVVDGCLRCPWHGSMFGLPDGAVVRGPATAPQPAYELAGHDGAQRARRRPAADRSGAALGNGLGRLAGARRT